MGDISIRVTTVRIMWHEAKNRKPEPPQYEICPYCEKGYLKLVEVKLLGNREIRIYRCSDCGEVKQGAKPARFRPVRNTDKFVRDPWRVQRKNPFAP